MTDNGDQDALNGLVNDCYGGKWPLAVHDLIHHPTRPDTVIYHMENESIMAWIKKIAYYETPIYPLAGTWVEGRLRELMGEAFVSMERWRDDIWDCAYWVDSCKVSGEPNCARGASPIQALVAALHEVLKAQKEVDGV